MKSREDLQINQESIEQLVVDEAQRLAAESTIPGFTISMFESITHAIGRYYRERGFFLARAYIPEQKVSEGIVTINIIEGLLDQVIYRDNQLYSEEQLADLFAPLVGESVFLEDIERVVFIANDFPGLDANILFGPGVKTRNCSNSGQCRRRIVRRIYFVG